MAKKISPTTKISPADAKKILIEARKQRVQEHIDNSTERAAEVLANLVDSEDVPPVVRMASAKDLLDRGGFKPVDRLLVAQVQPITGMQFELDGD